jgi:hypothetical protein
MFSELKNSRCHQQKNSKGAEVPFDLTVRAGSFRWRDRVTALTERYARLGLALTPMGPPMAQLKQGEAAWGASYAYSRNDLEVSGNGVDTKIGNVDLHTALATIRYGLATERMEVFARVGISGIDADHFDSGVEFAGGFGAKVTTNLERDLSWGILAQIM